MLIKINDQDTSVPVDLSEIPLGKFVQWYDTHGRSLDDDFDKLFKIDFDSDFDKDLAFSDHEEKEAVTWYSFWTGYDFEAVKNTEAADLIAMYRTIRSYLHQDENETLNYPWRHEWRGEQWEIKDWKVNPVSPFTFNELITSKEVLRQIYSLGKRKWDALIFLCAIFYRKVNEKFSDDLISEGSERLKLMEDLPLDIALQVAFFLSSGVSLWKNISRYSKKVEETVMLT